MKGSVRLGKVAGIGVFIHWTFSILILYIIFVNYRKGYDAAQIAWAVAFVLSIFVTVFLHEMGHALAAKRYGIHTRDITLLPIGGLARLDKLPEKPAEELVVAIAGPAVNVVLAILTALFVDFPDATEVNSVLAAGVSASTFLFHFFTVNLVLAVFNLIPAFPMDGGRVLRALLSLWLRRNVATRIAARIGQVLAIGFVFWGIAAGNPFMVFIALFIFLGAQAEAEYTQAQSMLKGYRVRDAVMRQSPAIEAMEPIKTAVGMLLNGQSKHFLVMENGVPAGTLSRDEIIKGLTESGEGATVAQIMNRRLTYLDALTPLEEAYQKSRQDHSDLMLVTENGRFAGTLDTDNILEFIMVRSALEKQGN